MQFAWQSSSLIVKAPAKINLALQILAKRSDGYHEIESVMAMVQLYDHLSFRESTNPTIGLTVSSTLGTLAETIPAGSDNLVLKAANLLRQFTGTTRSAEITLGKNIPSAAGLGGGSSDAAATLAGLNLLWKCGLSREELQQLGTQLGSDVPVFLSESPVALCRGRGEKVESVRLSPGWVVIARGTTGLSTAAVYKQCTPDGKISWSEQLLSDWRKQGWSAAGQRLRNGLQAPALSLNSDLMAMQRRFGQIPIAGHQMSGSGTAWFGLCQSRRHAMQCARQLRSMGAAWSVGVMVGP